ncbi:hypothetical protein [Mariniphaga anaerophila]|nr:hypothetical protein [Mariniphaga anaerophila]
MKKIAVVAALLVLFSCSDKNLNQPDPVDFFFDFAEGTDGWSGDFADYPVGEESNYELVFEYDTLPEPLDRSQMAIKQSGNNRSEDLFMFAKRKVSGLEPNTVYYITFTVEFATDVPNGLEGVGGSPGESVCVKVGATTAEPKKEKDSENFYRMNIDKGQQTEGGENMVAVSDFANGTDSETYTLKTVSNGSPFGAATDEDGNLWLIVGIDSGFGATTTVYYNSIKAECF